MSTDSSSSSEAVVAFEAQAQAQRLHHPSTTTSPSSISPTLYRQQHSRRSSRDPNFHSDGASVGSFLPSLVSDPSSHQNRSSSFSSTSSFSERHNHFYHEHQQMASEPATYGYQRNHSQHIYQAQSNNNNSNISYNDNNVNASPTSHLLSSEPSALYSLNQHHQHNNNQQSNIRDSSSSLLTSSSSRRHSKEDAVGVTPDYEQGILGSSLSNSRPAHSRQSSSASTSATSATIAQLHLHDHPSSSAPSQFSSDINVTGIRGALGPVSSVVQAEKAMHKVLGTEPGCVKSRRLAHILSEQKRREKINGGFDELKSVIPDCAQNTDSKATILRKATAYILLLEEELKRYSDAYPRPSDDHSTSHSQHHQEYIPRQ
ncbi:hypothetical protein FBU30_008542 [Linnemannia zychae]|nr:hypothetical protein FBU30_008542 [Linnemannia zychae]